MRKLRYRDQTFAQDYTFSQIQIWVHLKGIKSGQWSLRKQNDEDKANIRIIILIIQLLASLFFPPDMFKLHSWSPFHIKMALYYNYPERIERYYLERIDNSFFSVTQLIKLFFNDFKFIEVTLSFTTHHYNFIEMFDYCQIWRNTYPGFFKVLGRFNSFCLKVICSDSSQLFVDLTVSLPVFMDILTV